MSAKRRTPKRPFIHALYDAPKNGREIGEWSFAIIDRDAPQNSFTADEWQVVRRMVHTTGDFSIIEAGRFASGAIPSAIDALRSGQPSIPIPI
jgi:precorrin isomerase